MRKFLLTAALACAVIAFVPAVRAQEGQMDPKAMEELMIKLMTPGEPHAHLAHMAGHWNITMTSYMEGPEPVTTSGTYEAESVLGGRYMLGRYHGTAMGQPFEGLSIDGFDNGKQQYFSIWLDSMGTGYYIAHGTASPDGKSFKHQGTMTFGPMEIPSRSETVIVDNNTVKFTMWHTMEGQEVKAMDMTYARAK